MRSQPLSRVADRGARARVALRVARSPAQRRHEQGPARVVPDRRDGLRPAGGWRHLQERRQPRHLRSAVPLRLPRAAAQADPEHGRRAAGDHAGRQDVDDPHQAGHLLRRRSRRSRGRSASSPPPTTSYSWKRMLDPRMRSQRARALRRAHRRHGRGPREGEGSGQARLRRADRRPAGVDRTRSGSSSTSRIRAGGEPHAPRRPARSRAKSIEAYGDAQRLGDGQSGRHRALQAQGMAARAEDRARGEPGLPRRALPRERRPRRQGDHGEAQGQAHSAHRPRRDLHHRGSEPASARVRAAASSTTSTCRPTSSRTCSTAGNS